MSRSLVIRVGVWAAVLSPLVTVAAFAGFLVTVGSGTISDAAGSAGFYAAAGLSLASVVLLAPALVGLYLHEEERLGSFGGLAFVAALVGTALLCGAQWSYPFVLPRFAGVAPELVDEGKGSVLAGFLISYFAMAIGWTLFAVAVLRARSFGRGVSLFLVFGAAVIAVPMPARTLVLSLALGYLGSRLLRGAAAGLVPRSSSAVR